MIKELKFGTQVEGKKNGVFVAITAESQIYLNYEDPTMSKEKRVAFYPMILMVERWDGKTGFVGGFQEPEHTLLETANKELLEEINLKVAETHSLIPVCAHELEWLVAHLLHLNLGKTSFKVLKDILTESVKAEHCISEGTAKWVHLADYGRNKGLNTLLNSNVLASAVKEELEIVIKRLAA